MAVTKQSGEERRPSDAAARAERRAVGDVNPDVVPEVGQVADGVDDATRARVIHDTTTRERRARSKRAHEPLDLSLADDDQPDEANNGPRAAEVNAAESAKVESPTDDTRGKQKVSEKQLEAGRPGSDAQTKAAADALAAGDKK